MSWTKLPCPYRNRSGQCRYIAELTSLPVNPCGVTDEVCEACSRCDDPFNPLIATVALGIVVRAQPDRAESFRRALVRRLGDAAPSGMRQAVPGPPDPALDVWPVPTPGAVDPGAYVGMDADMTEDAPTLACAHRDPERRRDHTCGGCPGARRTLGVHMCRLHRRECTVLASDAVCDVTGKPALMCLTCGDRKPPDDPA